MPTRVVRHLTDLSRRERAPGIALAAATAIALVWANAWHASYSEVAEAARHIVNEGVMSAFFLLVGLEIRREIVAGELGSVRRALPPVVAAMFGMAVPGLIYAAVVRGGEGGGAWAIPMATDLAFALGAMALVDADLSLRARTFVLTLSVADDVLSIVVLILFYGGHFDPLPVMIGLVAFGAIAVAHHTHHAEIPVAALAGTIAWFAFSRAGIEPAIVGLPVGLILPHTGRAGAARLLGPRHLERMLQPWIVLGVLPVFAVVNVGVKLDPSILRTGAAGTIFLAVLASRVIGKPLGIGAAVLVLRVARRDPKVDFGHLLSAGSLAAAGLTVPLLVVELALPEGPQADAARAALLVASVIAVVLGWIVHAVAGRRRDGRMEPAPSEHHGNDTS
jgi:NhaA family Na+:H+ antiporter